MASRNEEDANEETTIRTISNSSTQLLPSEPFRPRTNSDLVRRLVDDDFQGAAHSFNYNPASNQTTIRLARSLWHTSVTTEGEFCGRTREVLKHLSPKCSAKYGDLLDAVKGWRPKREELVQKLNQYIETLDRNFKASTVVRFVASSADVSGSVGGLLCPSESEVARLAFGVASFCGLCGLVSTVAEVENSKRILDDVTLRVEEDHRLLEPVVRWMEETKELDAIVQEMFPHGIDMEIVSRIQEDRQEQEDYINVFRAALLTNVKKDAKLLQNKDFLHSVQLFARSEVAPLWWNRVLYRKHPIVLDLSRISLQMEFGQMQSIVFQCIPALPLEQQRLNSLPVAGRLMLNLLTMYDAFSDLRKGAKSMHSDKLRKLERKLSKELSFIEETVQEMKPQRSA